MHKEKAAIITGGSRGIGRAICLQLARDTDYHLIINYRGNREAAEQTLEEVKGLGGMGSLVPFDVADRKQAEKALSEWEAEHGDMTVEVLVNNAGITRDGLFALMEPEDWHSVLDTSLHGFYNVSRHFIQKMMRNRFGRIVNIVSVSGVKGTPGQVNYSAAKAALVGATKALAQEVARRNVTVNAVAPGFIKTDMTDGLDETQLKKLIPANRFGEPEEVAALVSFLISKNASYITGEVININGGIYS